MNFWSLPIGVFEIEDILPKHRRYSLMLEYFAQRKSWGLLAVRVVPPCRREVWSTAPQQRCKLLTEFPSRQGRAASEANTQGPPASHPGGFRGNPTHPAISLGRLILLPRWSFVPISSINASAHPPLTAISFPLFVRGGPLRSQTLALCSLVG